MDRVLFVNACMRGEGQSRTLRLCQRFLSEYTALRPQAVVHCRDLTGAELPVMTAERSRQRDELAAAGADHPLLTPAREMAYSDLVVVGAPYWDLSFPAALKVCLEWASCLGITFRYTEEGAQVGMSRARALVYVTTGGGPVRAQNLGYQYIQGWAAMMGVGETFCLAAENLDVWGTDVEAALTRAEGEIPALVRRAAGR